MSEARAPGGPRYGGGGGGGCGAAASDGGHEEAKEGAGQPPPPLPPECHDHSMFVSADMHDTAPPLLQDYVCSICEDVARDLVETECGHVFGEACLLRSLEACNNACPVCSKLLAGAGAYSAVRFLRRKVLSLPVKCRACEYRTTLKDLEGAHQGSCIEKQAACPYADVGCRTTAKRRDMAKHLDDFQMKHTLYKMDALSRANAELQQRLDAVEAENAGLRSAVDAVGRRLAAAEEKAAVGHGQTTYAVVRAHKNYIDPDLFLGVLGNVGFDMISAEGFRLILKRAGPPPDGRQKRELKHMLARVVATKTAEETNSFVITVGGELYIGKHKQ